MIRLTIPSIDETDLAAVSEVLASGFLIQGPKVKKFEERLAESIGVPHAVAVSNGTAALHLALLALDVRPLDIVLVTAYSWLSTANVIELCGATPVFVDIDPATYNMDPAALRLQLDRLSRNRETARRLKAVMPIDAFGQIADLPEILRIAGEYQLPVVEDAACALGARLQGKPAGAWTTLGTFSFHPRKAITTGEGGLITTSDPALAWKLRVLRNHGLDPDSPTPEFVAPGFNYRMTEFQGAFGLTQLAKLDRVVAARRSLACHYDRLLEGSPVTPPAASAAAEPVYQSYVCLLPADAAPRRKEIIAALKEKGIETTLGTWHMPMSTFFRTRYGYRPGDFPATDEVFARALSLPLYEGLQPHEQRHVVEALLEALR